MSKDTTEMVHCATIGQFTVLPLVSSLCYHWSVYCATIGQFTVLPLVSLSYLGEIFANPKKLI